MVSIRIVSCSLPKRIFLPPDSNSRRSQHRLAIEIDKIPPETVWLRFRCWSPSRKMGWIGPPGCPRIAGQRTASCGQGSDHVRGRCKGEARTGRQYCKVHYLFILLLGLKACVSLCDYFCNFLTNPQRKALPMP